MTWISTALAVSGLVLLAHAWYSAREFSTLQSLRSGVVGSAGHATSQTTDVEIPLDISIEAIVAAIITSLGIVLGAPSLRPIQWHVWAGKIESEGDSGTLGSRDPKNQIMNPFTYLDTRPGFVDIRRERREFASWVKNINI